MITLGKTEATPNKPKKKSSASRGVIGGRQRRREGSTYLVVLNCCTVFSVSNGWRTVLTQAAASPLARPFFTPSTAFDSRWEGGLPGGVDPPPRMLAPARAAALAFLLLSSEATGSSVPAFIRSAGESDPGVKARPKPPDSILNLWPSLMSLLFSFCFCCWSRGNALHCLSPVSVVGDDGAASARASLMSEGVDVVVSGEVSRSCALRRSAFPMRTLSCASCTQAGLRWAAATWRLVVRWTLPCGARFPR